MSLSNNFKIAAIYSPAIVGLVGSVVAAGGSLASTLIVLAAPLIGAHLYIKKLDADDERLKLVKPPARLQESLDKLQARVTEKKDVSIHMALNKEDIDTEHVAATEIVIGKDAYRRRSAEEMEFTIAHELGHVYYPKKSFVRNVETVGQSLAHSLSVWPYAATIITLDRGLIASLSYTCIHASAVIAQNLISKALTRREEYACDRFGVMLTGNPEAAIQSFERDREETRLAGKKDWFNPLSTHPADWQRIRAIERMAEQKSQASSLAPVTP